MFELGECQVLKTHEAAQVDIIDRLPTPFGLVRSGVAPDHPETKVTMPFQSSVATTKVGRPLQVP